MTAPLQRKARRTAAAALALALALALQACGSGPLYDWCRKRDFSPRVCEKYF